MLTSQLYGFSADRLRIDVMTSGDPLSSPTNRVAASFRAKRDATSAQLPDLGKATFSNRETRADAGHTESSARIRQKAQAFSSQMEMASLERRLLAAESEKKELEIRLTQKDRLVAKLESDRRWLADREKEEREEKEQERREREEEKVSNILSYPNVCGFIAVRSDTLRLPSATFALRFQPCAMNMPSFRMLILL